MARTLRLTETWFNRGLWLLALQSDFAPEDITSKAKPLAAKSE